MRMRSISVAHIIIDWIIDNEEGLHFLFCLNGGHEAFWVFGELLARNTYLRMYSELSFVRIISLSVLLTVPSRRRIGSEQGTFRYVSNGRFHVMQVLSLRVTKNDNLHQPLVLIRRCPTSDREAGTRFSECANELGPFQGYQSHFGGYWLR